MEKEVAHKKALAIKSEFVKVFSFYLRNQFLNRQEVGNKALAAVLRLLIDECDSISLKASEQIFAIADELDNLNYKENP
jgi:hypothetical protein